MPKSPPKASSTACVIGAGIGGLALAIRLQSGGIATTIVEARDKAGGHAYFWQDRGFTFDAGPSIITAPQELAELWALSGHDMARDVELLPVDPMFRLNWPDGSQFTLSGERETLRKEVARFSPGDLRGFEEFYHLSTKLYEDAGEGSGSPRNTLSGLTKAAPNLAKSRPWRSAYGTVSKYIRNQKLREALSFHTLLKGGNPLSISGQRAALQSQEMARGTYCARGGTNRLIAAMVRLFMRLGGEIRLDDKVAEIETQGSCSTGILTKSGWRGEFDAIVSNGDLVHTYRDLLGRNARGLKMGKRLAKAGHSPSMFIVHFGIEGSWPGIPHHMMLMGPRFEGLMGDIYDSGVLPSDQVIYLHHPTVTDPSIAPEGKSTFYAAIPVAHRGKLAIDWDVVGPELEKRVLDEVGRRLIPDIYERILTCSHFSPKQFANEMGAHMGSVFGLDTRLPQSLGLSANNRDAAIKNFYLVGAGLQRGSGMSGAIASAKTTAATMIKDMLK